MPSRFAPTLVVLSSLAASSCSSPAGSEPFHKPKYPDHAVVQPSVDPAQFTSGPAYDWENPAPWPSHTSVYVWSNFSNTRTFRETTAWITKAMDDYVAKNSEHESERFSDFHFRGCLFEWHEEQGSGTNHVNEYNDSVSLADANVSQIFKSGTRAFRLGWFTDNDPALFRAWEVEDGRWKNLGDRLDTTSHSRDFPVANEEMAERLTFAFLHAARLCGAKAEQ